MKQLLYFMIISIGSFMGLSCGDDKETILPSEIKDLTFEERPGEIFLQWDMPQDSTVRYVKVNYYDPLTEKNNLRLSSCDTILIPGTRQKFGAYDFSLRPVSYTGTEGEVKTIQATSGRAPITTIQYVYDIKLTPSQLSTNAQESSEGPIENLLDDNTGTFFHTSWSSNIPGPHWLQIDVQQELSTFRFYYAPRNNANNKPTDFDLLGSVDGNNWELIKNFTQEQDGLPTDSSTPYTSPDLTVDKPYTYLRILVNQTNNNTVYWTMSVFKLMEVEILITDPEAD